MSLSKMVLMGLTALVVHGLASTTMAADQPAPPPAAAGPTAVPFSGWTYRMTPYAWFTSLNGSQTIAGQRADIDATFPEIIDATIGSGGSLVALMMDMEARNGPYALFADVIGQSVTVAKSGVKTANVAPGVTNTVRTALDVTFPMAIVEGGGSYELGKIGPVAFDVLAGARFWYQKIEMEFNVENTVSAGGITVRGTKAIANAGSVDWLDGFVGLRARASLTPTQHIEIRGDLGGGGSRFTWNALAVYAYDFSTKEGVTYSAVIGYKALYADYAKGAGDTRYEFDMVQHGPVLGLSIRF